MIRLAASEAAYLLENYSEKGREIFHPNLFPLSRPDFFWPKPFFSNEHIYMKRKLPFEAKKNH